METILITHSYFLRLDPKQWKAGQPYAPLGTLYAAAVLRRDGFDIRFHDVQFSQGPEEIIPVMDEFLPSCLVICDDGFNYLTKMCLTNMREAAFEMIRLAKERGMKVIVSSSDATDHAEKYLQCGADFVVAGEPEQTLSELCRALRENQEEFLSIRGLVFNQNGALVKTRARPVLRNLDQLPLPAWDLVDFGPYKKTWLRQAGYFSVNIGTTRGCPFQCNWCAKPIYGNRYNAHSPARIAQQLKILQDMTGFDHVWFCDDIFGLKPGWVNEFADEVEKQGLDFSFKIQSRADLLVQENYVAALKRAGCTNVWMGAESGSQKILDAMDKGTTISQIHEATRLLKEHGIKPSFFIQFGYPGETRSDIALTIQMIHELMPHEIGISVSYPLPGTVFYENVKEQLREKSNWIDSDELALMFRNTFPPGFYKQLHRYVHRNYRKRMALLQLSQLVKKPLRSNWTSLKKAISGIYLIPSVYLEKRKLKNLERSL